MKKVLLSVFSFAVVALAAVALTGSWPVMGGAEISAPAAGGDAEAAEEPEPQPEVLNIVEITPEMFKEWTSGAADAVPVGSAACYYEVGNPTTLVYGNTNIKYTQYADLSKAKTLKVEVAEGDPRICLNRLVDYGKAPEGMIDNTNEESAAKYFTVVAGENGAKTVVVDIEAIVAEWGCAHLNAIKSSDWLKKVNVTRIYAEVAPEPEPEYTFLATLGGVELSAGATPAIAQASGIAVEFGKGKDEVKRAQFVITENVSVTTAGEQNGYAKEICRGALVDGYAIFPTQQFYEGRSYTVTLTSWNSADTYDAEGNLIAPLAQETFSFVGAAAINASTTMSMGDVAFGDEWYSGMELSPEGWEGLTLSYPANNLEWLYGTADGLKLVVKRARLYQTGVNAAVAEANNEEGTEWAEITLFKDAYIEAGSKYMASILPGDIMVVKDGTPLWYSKKTITFRFDATGTVETGPALEPGDYYIYNPTAGQFLNGSQNWGTRASLTKYPQRMTLLYNDGTYTIDSHISDGGDKHYLSKTDFNVSYLYEAPFNSTPLNGDGWNRFKNGGWSDWANNGSVYEVWADKKTVTSEPQTMATPNTVPAENLDGKLFFITDEAGQASYGLRSQNLCRVENGDPNFAPKFSPLATDGSIQYLYNVEAGAFLLGANDWNTRASVDDTKGWQFKIEDNGNGTYTLVNKVESRSNQWLPMFVENPSSMWMDHASQPNWDNWTITPNGDGTYKIGNQGVAGDLGVNKMGSDSRLYMGAENTTWAFVNEADYNAWFDNQPRYVRFEKLSDADKASAGVSGNIYKIRFYNRHGSTPYTVWGWGGSGYLNFQPGTAGVVFALNCEAPQFGQDGQNLGLWDVTYEAGKGYLLENVGRRGNYASPVSDTPCWDKAYVNMYNVDVVATDVPVYESYEHSRWIGPLAAGTYKLIVNGFYRNGGTVAGQQKSNAELWVGDPRIASTKIKTLSSIPAPGGGDNNYPYSMDEAQAAFEKGLYINEVTFTIAEDGAWVPLGVSGIHEDPYSWICLGKTMTLRTADEVVTSWSTFVDNATPAQVTIKKSGKNLYTINGQAIKNGGEVSARYLAPTFAGVDFASEVLTNDAKWQLIPATDEAVAEFLSTATMEKAVPVPGIGDAGFSRNNLDFDMWQGDKPGKGNVGTAGYRENVNAEKWGGNSQEFNTYQTIKVPNGKYMLKLQGFYRYNNTTDNTNAVAEAAHKAGTEVINSVFYANEVEKPLLSIADEASLAKIDGGNMPFSQAEASAAFNAGAYQNSLMVTVTDGKITVGVKKVKHEGCDWTVWDAVELYCLGTETGAAMAPIVITLAYSDDAIHATFENEDNVVPSYTAPITVNGNDVTTDCENNAASFNDIILGGIETAPGMSFEVVFAAGSVLINGEPNDEAYTATITILGEEEQQEADEEKKEEIVGGEQNNDENKEEENNDDEPIAGQPTGINGIAGNSIDGTIYNAQGAQLNAIQRGVNIIRKADGTIVKVLVK